MHIYFVKFSLRYIGLLYNHYKVKQKPICLLLTYLHLYSPCKNSAQLKGAKNEKKLQLLFNLFKHHINNISSQ